MVVSTPVGWFLFILAQVLRSWSRVTLASICCQNSRKMLRGGTESGGLLGPWNTRAYMSSCRFISQVRKGWQEEHCTQKLRREASSHTGQWSWVCGEPCESQEELRHSVHILYIRLRESDVSQASADTDKFKRNVGQKVIFSFLLHAGERATFTNYSASLVTIVVMQIGLYHTWMGVNIMAVGLSSQANKAPHWRNKIWGICGR